MLRSISIKNIVLIEALHFEIERGLCVLTGETGSGKSILLDALGLATGRRSSSRLLRTGENQGFVIAEFDIDGNTECTKLLEENGIEYSDAVILKRILYSDGRSKAFINDMPVGQVLLDQVGDTLMEVHGQHEQRGLLNPSVHKDILDSYGDLTAKVKDVGFVFDEMKKIESQLNDLKNKRDEAIREQDYLAHVCNELESLKLEEGEEEKLAEKRTMLMNKEKILNLLNNVKDQIEHNNNVQNSIAAAQGTLLRGKELGENLAEGENKFEQIIDSLEKASIEIDEALKKIDEVYSIVGYEEQTLEEVEERLFAIRGLSRKFNTPANELPNLLLEMKQKLALIENEEVIMGDLEERLEEVRGLYLSKAKDLSDLRKLYGEKLADSLVLELEPLKMGATKFEVQVLELDEQNWSRTGINSVRFLASTNPGTPMSDLSKIASGGELSRFMLALKVVISKVRSVPTIIFDEIDTGIGGAVADAVGKRLKSLGDNAQVLVVTHHPQVAAKGNYHLRVRKEQQQNFTNTMLDVLSDDNERKNEIARMLSGDIITEEALKAAERLLEN
jgi:DNA repair protein RecN (Recombination protein N)